MLRAVQGGKGVNAIDGMNHILMELCFGMLLLAFFKAKGDEERRQRGREANYRE